MVHHHRITVNLMGKNQRTEKRGIALEKRVLNSLEDSAEVKFKGKNQENPINKTQSVQVPNFSISNFFKFRYANFFCIDK
jgi:hypothetical protein